MYGYEQKCKAIDTYFLFDCRIADTVAELGYPNRHTLYLRVQDYKKHGEVRRRRQARDPRYTGGKEALRRRPPPVPRKEPGEDDEGDGISWQQGIPLRMDRQIRSGAAEAQAPRPKPRAAVPRTQDRDRRRPGGQKRSRRRGGRRVRGVGIRAVSLAQAAPLGRQCLRGERMRRGEAVSARCDEPPNDVDELGHMAESLQGRVRRLRPELDVRQATPGLVKKTRAPTRTG